MSPTMSYSLIPRRPWVFVISETWASSNAADIGVVLAAAMTLLYALCAARLHAMARSRCNERTIAEDYHLAFRQATGIQPARLANASPIDSQLLVSTRDTAA